MGFYALRAPVAILPALALAAWWLKRRGQAPGPVLLSGMGDASVMLMCLIFLLAGAFAAVTQAIGAVDAVVALGLAYLIMLALGPDGRPVPATGRHGVSRALDRLRQAGGNLRAGR